MKLKKLKISELTNYRHLNHQEMRQYVGGYGGEKYCFFNCLEYFAKEICGNQTVDWSFFDEAYYGGDGDFRGTHDLYQYTNGPKLFNDKGELNPQIFNFFSHYFNVEGSGWLMGNNDIQTLFASGSVDNTAIMGIFNTGLTDGSGESVAHAVILQSYDAATDTYTYYDPSCSNEEDRIKTVSGKQMLFAARAGCK